MTVINPCSKIIRLESYWYPRKKVLRISNTKINWSESWLVRVIIIHQGRSRRKVLFVKMAFSVNCSFKITPCFCFSEQFQLVLRSILADEKGYFPSSKNSHQRAKKVVSNTEELWNQSAPKNVFEARWNDVWLVNVSFSLPEWQAVKMTFFAPCLSFKLRLTANPFFWKWRVFYARIKISISHQQLSP